MLGKIDSSSTPTHPDGVENGFGSTTVGTVDNDDARRM